MLCTSCDSMQCSILFKASQRRATGAPVLQFAAAAFTVSEHCLRRLAVRLRRSARRCRLHRLSSAPVSAVSIIPFAAALGHFPIRPLRHLPRHRLCPCRPVSWPVPINRKYPKSRSPPTAKQSWHNCDATYRHPAADAAACVHGLVILMTARASEKGFGGRVTQ
jgi:hypothetical protein